jgi:transcriptional regulator with XRE-family HTH domain
MLCTETTVVERSTENSRLYVSPRRLSRFAGCDTKQIFIGETWREMAGASKNISEYVSQVMKLKGLTQKDVQRMSGGRITDGYVASITRGRAKNLSVDKLKALADGLGVDADALFHVACGRLEGIENSGSEGPDILMILETVQKAVMSPDVTAIVEEVVSMRAEERSALLKSIKRLDATKKSRSKSKSD